MRSVLPPLLLLCFVLVGCGRNESPEVASDAPAVGKEQGATGAVAKAPATGPVDLSDVSEITSDYAVGITFPSSAVRYPRLAAELKAYADEARTNLQQAVAARGTEQAGNMYDLSLSFSEIVDTPRLYAVAADGSSYTGGAHSAPLLARFVWLPEQDRRLAVSDLVPDADAWPRISEMVREQLHTALSQRLDADRLAPEERASMMREALRMIDDGTGPEPENYSEFEPVVDASGKIVAIRFVFPPYQVGPYSDGVQVVQLPASALMPYVAQEYRSLFAPA